MEPEDSSPCHSKPRLELHWMCPVSIPTHCFRRSTFIRLRLDLTRGLGPSVHPRVIVMWTMVWWYRLVLTPNLATRALWQPPVLSGGPFSRGISGASRRMGEGNENLVCPSPWDFKRSLTYRKILRRGTSGFTYQTKEGVLRIFIGLKNPSPWLGSNPRPLGPVASTLITTPPRWPPISYYLMIVIMFGG
jgi:hypothetical protein